MQIKLFEYDKDVNPLSPKKVKILFLVLMITGTYFIIWHKCPIKP